ncbi:MAG: RpiB/LacA/LacB family sugar-phosphate isomerase [Chitinivibrionales bacterium]|nr:RpiB/LacA/LacB family sugar-phosphate isomerase [Chitinivibrionales bacterium]MBD3357243.1 RpiB/LacA/LacB family sugar-phosphate isomerase [Chitinivibrionales bacterium]
MADKHTIIIGGDHAGFPMKEIVRGDLEKLGYATKDVGTFTADEPADYPGYASKVAMAVSTKVFERGVLVCGTGMGTSIVANRFPHVRAVVCTNYAMAVTARTKLDCNLLVLGNDYTHELEIGAILKAWLETKFEGGRHARRVNLIDDNNLLNLALGHLEQVNPKNLSEDRINQPFLKRALAGLDNIQKILLPTEQRNTNYERQSQSCPATIVHDGTNVEAVMIDLSEKGAQFQISAKEKHPYFIRDDQLDMEIKTSYGSSKCKGLVRWYDTTSRHLGVAFTEFPTGSKDPLRLQLDSML